MDGRTPVANNFDTLREIILRQRSSLPKRIAQVADYVLANPDDIAFGTVAGIAASTGVSPSTLIRFSHHLGFDGFTSLQTVFRRRLHARTLSRRGQLDGRRASVVDRSTVLFGRSIETVFANLSDAAFEETLACLTNARTIYVVAHWRFCPIATYLTSAFAKCDIRYQLVDAKSDIDACTLAFATENDVAIVIDVPANFDTTLNGVHALENLKATIIAIASDARSPLAATADTCFEVADTGVAGASSLFAAMTLAMALSSAVAETRQNKHATTFTRISERTACP